MPVMCGVSGEDLELKQFNLARCPHHSVGACCFYRELVLPGTGSFEFQLASGRASPLRTASTIQQQNSQLSVVMVLILVYSQEAPSVAGACVQPSKQKLMNDKNSVVFLHSCWPLLPA